mgnify:CR=1 FL=1
MHQLRGLRARVSGDRDLSGRGRAREPQDVHREESRRVPVADAARKAAAKLGNLGKIEMREDDFEEDVEDDFEDPPTTQLPGSGTIEREVQRRLGERRPFAFCYLDLDNLKAYNDYYGFAKADGVIRQTGDLLREVFGQVVVLCAQALESARILLNSKSARFPQGLGNSTGNVGKYLTDSTGVGLTGFIPAMMDMPPHNEDGVGGMHLYMPWWLDNKKLPFPRGYHIEIGGGRRMPSFGFMGNIHLYAGVQGSGTPPAGIGYGKKLKDDYRRFYGATVLRAKREQQRLFGLDDALVADALRRSFGDRLHDGGERELRRQRLFAGEQTSESMLKVLGYGASMSPVDEVLKTTAKTY